MRKSIRTTQIAVLFLLLFALQAAAQQTKRLVVWHTENDPLTVAALEEIGRDFSTQNPGVKVEFLFAGWDDLYRRLLVAIQGKDVPTLTQIEPFMAKYLVDNGQLLPMDDVIEKIGKDRIFPVVRDLQEFGGKHYGIGTALGISYVSYRKDWADPAIPAPRTWDEYIEYIQKPPIGNHRAAPVLLPANDLHIVLLFSEFLAANKGSLFNEKGEPAFDNPQVIQTLAFWKKLYDLQPSELRNSPYGENFTHFARGQAFSLPSFFGRGTLQIDRSASPEDRTPEHFALLPHPKGPSGDLSYATLDSEPWVILKNSPDPDLARRFLVFFYSRDEYLKFCASVPIHLTPIFRDLATGSDYVSLNGVQRWRPYYDEEIKMLDGGRVLPIFMSKPEDRQRPELFKLEGSRIVSDMVRDVCQRNIPPEQAVKIAMAKVSALRVDHFESTTAGSRRMWLLGLILVVLISGAMLMLRYRRR